MNILFINEYFTQCVKTGANTISFSTYFLMKEKGNTCYFYSNDEGTLFEKQNINKFFPKSHIYTNSFLYRLNSIYNFEAAQNLEKVIKETKPDIVHIHAIMELSYSFVNVLKKHNIPYIITVHDPMYVCPVMGTRKQYCTLCSDNIFNCVKNRCSRDNYFNSLYMAIRFFINKKLIKNYEPKIIITPSKALQSYIKQTKFSKTAEFSVIPNALDKTFLNVIPNYKNKGYFLFVGNLLDVKGVNILLEAINNLPKDIDFHIIGDGLQKEKYLQFVKENNLNNVKFLGKKNRDELILEYQNCIAVIVPSNWFEIFGMINIEAFINGKPVIASNIGGIPEQVENEKTGLLFEPANVAQLQDCILKYWKNPDLVVEHGKNAYEKAKKQYSEERYYNELIQIYNKVLNLEEAI